MSGMQGFAFALKYIDRYNKTSSTMQKEKLSHLMRMSGEIQRRKKCRRSKALLSAWAIVQNADVTIYYLVKRHSHSSSVYPNRISENSLSLFRQ